MNKSGYAKHRGITPAAVTKAIKHGKIHLEADGTIDPVKADAEWEANTRKPSKRAEAQSLDDQERYNEAKKADLYYRDKINRLELLYMQGVKEDSAILRREYIGKVLQINQRLESIPHRIAPLIAAASSEEEARKILIDAINEVYNI